ncbi:hypothetical protein GJV85_01250 [Sulfurimonas aquatica]|uniref:TRL-like family protein n=1 Tax=Sulfurimonas aquatica TaxID=2672570 RepID=A0A975AYF6_9BACT|nr:hypothetical protein [Sulfurimonas aquatica]QSZ40795.1 hypothetical protein GJV85_01250 [Sulfurimonas aquatica]
MIKNTILVALATLTMSGCAHKMASTPATMSYDGSNIDYSKINEMKVSKVCHNLTEPDADTTIVTAAKRASISKIKHVDTSFEYSTFLFWTISPKSCVTVYGQ